MISAACPEGVGARFLCQRHKHSDSLTTFFWGGSDLTHRSFLIVDFRFLFAYNGAGRGNGKRAALRSIAIFGSHELDAAR
jgi:hypothetical protein